MSPKIGQRWRYTDNGNDYIAEIYGWDARYEEWQLRIIDSKRRADPYGKTYITSKLRSGQSIGGESWIWTYLTGQDRA